MRPTTRTREYRQGMVGRFRTYHCRICGRKFRQFCRNPLPEKLRLCPSCHERDYASR